MSEDEHGDFLWELKQKLKLRNWEIQLITNISYPDYQPGRGVGYDRNFLLQHTKEDFWQYIYMIDQDNEFEKDHFEKMLEKYQRLQKEQSCQSILLSPTVERRKSGKIQSRGILGMYYLFPKYIFNKNYDSHGYSQVQMIGGNSLFGPMQAMQAIGFDEQMKYFCEDIDFSYRWFQSGAKIFVAHDIRIHHMERDQTPLSSRCLHTPVHAYARAYNRVRFVKKTASFSNKRAYLLCGVWVQTVLFLGLCLLYGWEQKWKLIGAVWRGTRDGVFW
jgi:GT2 family glycosyltransferase